MRCVLCLLIVLGLSWGGLGPAFADEDPAQAAFDRADYRAAQRLWTPAAKQGDPVAQFGLGRILLFYLDEGGVRWIRKSAEDGHLPAEYHFGLMNFQATYMPRDVAKGVRWLKRATRHPAADEAAHPVAAARALHALAMAYATGLGTSKDTEAALQLLRRAADLGYADAQGSLATRLQRGEGAPRDLVGAHTYFVLVWKQGVPAAKKEALAIRGKLSPEQFERSRKEIRKWLAAQKAGSLGQAWRFKDRVTRGQRILEKGERLTLEVLQMAMMMAAISGVDCETVWLRRRDVLAKTRAGALPSERWIMDRCGDRVDVRVDYHRSGTQDVRYEVKVMPGGS